MRPNAVIVDVESVCQAKPPFERDATNEGSSGESLLLQQRRDRRGARLQAIAAVVADAMLVRVCSCQDAGMRGTREYRVRVREFETQPYRREVVQIGRARRPAVRAERIRPERIDCDEQQVLIWLALDIGAPRPASGHQPGRCQETEDSDGQSDDNSVARRRRREEVGLSSATASLPSDALEPGARLRVLGIGLQNRVVLGCGRCGIARPLVPGSPTPDAPSSGSAHRRQSRGTS